MIWLDIIALACAGAVLITANTFYSRLFGAMVIIHYIAATISNFGGDNVQPVVRLFSFTVIFLGTGLSIVTLFAQSNRDKRETE